MTCIVRWLVRRPFNSRWIGEANFSFIKAWGGLNTGYCNRRTTQRKGKLDRHIHGPLTGHGTSNAGFIPLSYESEIIMVCLDLKREDNLHEAGVLAFLKKTRIIFRNKRTVFLTTQMSVFDNMLIKPPPTLPFPKQPSSCQWMHALVQWPNLAG